MTESDSEITDSLPLSGQRVGPYRLERQLGAGGMGEVYRAFDERLDRAVAIKRVQASFTREGRESERFWREARSIAKLRHPAIIEIFDIVEEHGSGWIVMELIVGQTLTQALEPGPLPVDQALELFSQLASALAEAHEHGILHRDLKADNVMIDRHGRPKLLDFGLAHSVEQDRSRLTAKDRILGTPEAMSPEQALGDTLGPPSDIFSLGSLLYRSVTGEAPFYSENPLRVLQKVAFSDYQDPRQLNPDLPEGLCRLIDCMLEKEIERRPRSASDVAFDLAELSQAGAREGVPSRDLRRIAQASPAPSSATLVEVPPPQETVTAIGERRQITILQCELSPADEAQDTLDPEEVLELRPQLTALITPELEAFGGSIGQLLDQGYLVYFGLPNAREDDARRAVHAARAVLKKARQTLAPHLALRIGLHTGPVVVAPQRDGKSKAAKLAFGQTLAWAAGVTSLARPGEILLSAATHATVERFFSLEPLQATEIPGLGPHVEAFRDTGDRNDLQQLSDGATFVGREQQLLLLLDHWQLAREGNGQAVLMSGEAGIGKSRLVREIEARAAVHTGTILRCQCSPYERHTPFAPIIHLLRQMIQEHPGDGSQTTALRRFLEPFDLPFDEIVPLIGSLLSLSVDGSTGLEMSPPVQRQKTLEALVTLLLEMAENSPLLFVVEDLHWVDPSSQELIDLLVQHGPSVPILLLLTARPTFESPWNQRAHVVRMTLGRLGRDHVEKLIHKVATGPLPAGLLDAIIDRADGVPLFVEEITKAMTESDGQRHRSGVSVSQTSDALPVSLQDFLMARLDPLGEAKVIAQHAAVLGRVFTLAELVAVTGASQAQLEDPLEKLVDAELLYRRGMGSALRFSFKHALIQDAAYQSLLKGPRRRIHASVARFLEKKMLAGKRSAHPHERIAHHFGEAGMAEQALDSWYKAGKSANARSAHLEAAAHFEAALGQLERRPEADERDVTELELQTLLASARVATQGFGSPDVQRAYARAYELCEIAGDSPRLAWVLQGLWAFYETTVDLPKSVELGNRILRLADRTGDENLRFEGFYALGNSCFFLGDLEESVRLLNAAIALELPDRESRRNATGLDPVVSSLAFSGVIEWHAGKPTTALERVRKAIEEARALEHPFSLAFAVYMACWVHNLRGERELLEPLALEVVELSERHRYFWLNLANMQLGWARGAVGDDLREIGDSIEAYVGTDARLGLSYYLAIYADMAIEADELELANQAVDRGLSYIEETGEVFYLAELHRLAGKIAHRCPELREQSAAESLRKGLDVAKKQGARALQLRLAVALAELPLSLSGDDAVELLSQAIKDFSEAQGTRDWSRAQHLLQRA